MTDFQFKKLMEMILEILKSSSDLDDAIEKVEKFSKET